MSDTPASAEQPEEAPVSPQAVAEPATPPFLIRHLLIITAVTWVALFVLNVKTFFVESGPSLGIPLIGGAFSGACAVTLLALRWSWRRRGLRWLSGPGDAALLLVVVNLLFSAPTLLMQDYFMRGQLGYFGEDIPEDIPVAVVLWMEFSGIIYLALLTLLALFLAFTRADTWVWRLWFVALPVSEFLAAFLRTAVANELRSLSVGSDFTTLFWLELAADAPYFLWLALLALAALNDLGRKREWTHWWGVVAAGLPCFLFMAMRWGLTLWHQGA